MSRPSKHYRLWFNKQTGYFYYKLPGGAWRTTGCQHKTDANNVAQQKWRENAPAPKPKATGTVGSYFNPYFDWDRCPRIADRRAEGKRISPQHAKRQRMILEKYLLNDKLMSMPLRRVIPEDIRAFRQRMIDAYTPRVINSITTVLKTVFRDLLRRGIIQQDPTQIIGKMSYEQRESGTFTKKELRDLFKTCPGPWGDRVGYTCFLVAASTGMRRGEVLALRWKHVDLDNKVLHVKEAWKDRETVGEPKWGQKRSIPLPDNTIQALKKLRRSSVHVLPDALVFTYDGDRLGATWWQGRFVKAMKAAGIDAKKRRLTAHSFRHTLATLLRAEGISDVHIQAALGWTNVTTQEIYTHFTAEHLKNQATVTDRLFGKVANNRKGGP